MTIANQTTNPATFVGNNRLLTGMVLGVLTFWLFYQSLFNVVPAIQSDLALGDNLNAVIGLGSLFSGCFIVLMGGLADRFGRVRFTYLGFGLNILACVLLYFGTSTATFGLGRVLQGLSAACIMPATMSLIKTYYHDEQRQKAISYWSIGSFGGSGLSSFVGGLLAVSFGWKSIFLFSIAVSILGIILIKGTPESKATAQTDGYDYVGLFSFVIGLLALNLLITKALSWGITSTITLVMFATFVVMTVVFFATAKKLGTRAFLDFSLFDNKAFSGACLSNFLLNSMSGMIFAGNLFLQKGLKLTALQAGLYSLGYVAAVMVVIRLSVKFLKDWGYKKPMQLGAGLAGFGAFLLSLTMLPIGIYLPLVAVSMVVFGIGLGFYSTPAADCVMVNIPMDKAGVGTAVFKMASALGATLGIAVAATLFTTVEQSANIHTAAQYSLLAMSAFGVLAMLAVMALVPKKSD